ncbi:MAG: succinyl-diaminopimelate desuccinylase [Gammaproteobacteria bacterium]|nr:succinyl-diaminopimelate desuccinylase [Gammaproteobacteria bacterium]
MSKTVEFTCELIRRASITPRDEGCQELIGERLRAAGFSTETLQFGEVTNLWARHGEGAPVFCFAGHTDVVPPGDLAHWDSDPFTPEIRDGKLYGRGAADMKCSLAAMTDAATGFVDAHPAHRGTIAFLITSDEEGRARDGTLRAMQELAGRGEKIDWCLIGEPSCGSRLGDTVRVGRRGSLSGIITVNGIAGHVAYPQLARNPIQLFAPVITELYETPLDQGNEFFPPSSFQVVNIAAGEGAPNVIPGKLDARFNFRYSTTWTYQQLQAHVEALLARHGIDCELRWHLSGEPFLTPVGALTEAISAVVHEVTGLVPELSTGGGTSDGRFIAPYGTHVVEFGAINDTIHKANEHVAVADIDRIRDVYRAVLERMMGAATAGR